MKFYFSGFCQKFAFIASGPCILPIRTALIPRGLADRVGFRIQKRIQRILDGLSDKSVEMRPNLFFIDFNRSGDCLLVFLRCIFPWPVSLSFDYGLITIIQKTGPFSSALS